VTNAQQIAAEIPHPPPSPRHQQSRKPLRAEPDNTFTFGPRTILEGFETRLATAP
jgi:hypothetical protein